MVETDRKTLLPINRDWVLPGSTIISVCWSEYKCLEDKGFQHLSVKHSLNFADPETGAHTNLIEGMWSAIKRSLPRKHDRNHYLYLAEYMSQRLYNLTQIRKQMKLSNNIAKK